MKGVFLWQNLHFNSQPHEEADDIYGNMRLMFMISTHSLTRRLTATFVILIVSLLISTHSLTRRLTSTPTFRQIKYTVFQLTASRGG